MRPCAEKSIRSLLLALAGWLGMAAHAQAGECSVWLVNTRYASSANLCAGGGQVRFARCEGRNWTESSRAEFLTAEDAYLPTIFFIHGSNFDATTALRAGLRAKRQLVRGDQACRFVIWSWPTERGRRALPSIRADYSRSHPEGVFLGKLLGQLDDRVPVTLIGYSMGARVCASALHRYASQPRRHSAARDVFVDPRQHNVVLIAAAMDDCDLIRGHRYGNALDVVDELHVIYNSCDTVLKRYQVVEKRGVAIGYVGLDHGRNRVAVRQANVCGLLGKRHGWSYYEQTRILARYARAAIKKELPLPIVDGPDLAVSLRGGAD